MATSTTSTSTSPEALFSSPATMFSREGIHYFLDMVMDLFPITEQEQQQQQEEDKTGNNHSSSTNASGTDCDEKSASEENSFEGEGCGKNTNKEPSSNRSSYVDDSADDSSVEDTSHFIVGGMNMSRFGGVGGNGYRSTNAINFIPTAVTERTEEDNCSLATGYRLGRSSFSSVFQHHHATQNQINIVTSLSNLSHVFNTAIGTSTVGVVVPSPTSPGQPASATTTTTTGIGAAKVTGSSNTEKVITTTNSIDKNCSNLSDDDDDDRTVTTQEESSSSNDSDDDEKKEYKEDEVNKTESK